MHLPPNIHIHEEGEPWSPLASPLSSPTVSRPSSPTPPSVSTPPDSPTYEPDTVCIKCPAGLQPDDVYKRLMSPTRYAIRQFLVNVLDREMPILPRIQKACRSRRMDQIMIASSWLGSHTFFMLFLPMCYWFDRPRWGEGLVYILAASVYLTGSIKDYTCVPRPYSPPVVRLSIGSHGAEYGFPSTHSATSFGSALFAVQLISEAYSQSHPAFDTAVLGLFMIILLVYIVTLVFGRLYCGMHSIQDVVFGSLLGGSIWALHATYSPMLGAWVSTGSNWVPPTTILTALFFISAHPQPVDDCPCFEDSTAFVSVAVGTTLARWAHARFPDLDLVHPSVTRFMTQLSPTQRWAWFTLSAIAKLVIGLSCIFIWRSVAKDILSRLLPPFFNLVTPLLELPRRHYVPVTDYEQYKKDQDVNAIIPSMIDLPTIPDQDTFTPTTTMMSASTTGGDDLHPNLRNRTVQALAVDPLYMVRQVRKSQHLQQNKTSTSRRIVIVEEPQQQRQKDKQVVVNEKEGQGEGEVMRKSGRRMRRQDPSMESQMPVTLKPPHYEPDVLMRVIVYAGIGFIAAYPLPVLFNAFSVHV